MPVLWGAFRTDNDEEESPRRQAKARQYPTTPEETEKKARATGFSWGAMGVLLPCDYWWQQATWSGTQARVSGNEYCGYHVDTSNFSRSSVRTVSDTSTGKSHECQKRRSRPTVDIVDTTEANTLSSRRIRRKQTKPQTRLKISRILQRKRVKEQKHSSRREKQVHDRNVNGLVLQETKLTKDVEVPCSKDGNVHRMDSQIQRNGMSEKTQGVAVAVRPGVKSKRLGKLQLSQEQLLESIGESVRTTKGWIDFGATTDKRRQGERTRGRVHTGEAEQDHLLRQQWAC